MILNSSKEKWTARLFILMVVLHVAQSLLRAEEDFVWKHCCLPSFAFLIRSAPSLSAVDIASHVAYVALRWVGHSLFHADVSHIFSNLLLFAWVGPALEHGHEDVLGEGVREGSYKWRQDINTWYEIAS